MVWLNDGLKCAKLPLLISCVCKICRLLLTRSWNFLIKNEGYVIVPDVMQTKFIGIAAKPHWHQSKKEKENGPV